MTERIDHREQAVQALLRVFHAINLGRVFLSDDTKADLIDAVDHMVDAAVEALQHEEQLKQR